MLDPKELRARSLASQARRLEQGLSARKTPLERLAENPTSLRLSVNAMCYECNGRENAVNRTRFCAVFDCPLWSVRPYGKGITLEHCKQHVESGNLQSVDDDSLSIEAGEEEVGTLVPDSEDETVDDMLASLNNI